MWCSWTSDQATATTAQTGIKNKIYKSVGPNHIIAIYHNDTHSRPCFVSLNCPYLHTARDQKYHRRKLNRFQNHRNESWNTQWHNHQSIQSNGFSITTKLNILAYTPQYILPSHFQLPAVHREVISFIRINFIANDFSFTDYVELRLYYVHSPFLVDYPKGKRKQGQIERPH